MKRREIPLIEMLDHGQEELRRDGFVSVRFSQSYAKDPARLSPHYHDFFQVSLLSGPCTLMHDFREAEVSGETLLFLSPGEVHNMRPQPGTDGTIVSFTREFFGGAVGSLFDLPFFHAVDVTPWISLEESAAGPLQSLFREIQDEFDRAEHGADEILRSLLGILFVRSTRLYQDREATAGAKAGNAIIRQFHQSVESHFRDWPSLAPYARLQGITVNHLNDVVRNATGRSAGDHIRSRRLLDSKRLLLHSELSVAEIGYREGFKDPSYFNRFFRREEGVTPAAFRRHIREKYHNPGH